jgi:hypothetical protein
MSTTRTKRTQKQAGGYRNGVYPQTQDVYRGPALPKPVLPLPPHLKKRTQELEKGNVRSKANPTYGWKLRSPQKGVSRHLLLQKCGSRCFLMPEREGFPICTKYELTAPKCEMDCGGISTAYRRAKQYKYPQVAKEAKALLKKLKC